MRTKVFITIDTEFSIGGAFVDPLNNGPIGAQNVLCEVHGRSEGLGFMLETFRAHGIRATFFTEAQQTAFFGDRPMGELVQRIAAAGSSADRFAVGGGLLATYRSVPAARIVAPDRAVPPGATRPAARRDA